jgi:hypothetical protein
MFTLHGDMWNICCDQAAPGAHTKLQPFQHVTTKHQAELQPLYIIYSYIFHLYHLIRVDELGEFTRLHALQRLFFRD